MPTPDDTLAAWPAHWLSVSCGCGRRVHLPVKLPAREHGGQTTLPHLVARLRCRDCGERVTNAELVTSPQTTAPGYAHGF